MVQLICLLLFLNDFTIFDATAQEQHKSGFYYVTEQDFDTETSMQSNGYVYKINEFVIGLDDVEKVRRIKSKIRPYHQIEFIFTPEGAKKWEAQTEKYANKKLGFIHNGKLLETVTVMEKISSGKCSLGFLEVTDFDALYQDLKKSVEKK